MPTTLLDEDRGDWAAARARRFREEAEVDARIAGTTLCWQCNRAYPRSDEQCPFCWAANANFPESDAARAEATCNLIAAAPDLLAALEVTEGNIRSLRDAGICKTYDKWLEVVQAAIAKAKGLS